MTGRRHRSEDAVIDTLAQLLGSRSPAAARQALRRADAVVRAFATACYRHHAGHRLVRFHAMTLPVPPVDALDREDWLRHGATDRSEDAARESLALADESVEELRRYRGVLAREISEKLTLMARLEARLA